MKLNIKLLTRSLIIALSSLSLNAQTLVCLGDNAIVCSGSSVTIQDCNPGNNNTGIVMTGASSVNLSDDSWSPVVNIGFTFNFYGVNYTQCTIGSNGLVSFNLGNANGYCPWSLGAVAPLPNAGFAAAKNTQMIAYHDMNPSVWASPNGQILYKTVGTAPNRQFVVLYSNIMDYGPGGFCSYMAIIMNETANSFEYHIGFKAMSPSWNGGLAIQGSENAAGNIAHMTPGRNNTQWAVLIPEAKKWTPTAPGNTSAYTISNIPYTLFLSPSSTYEWANTQNGTTWPYNAGNLTINPVLPAPPDSIGYYLTVDGQACNIGTGGASDTTWIIPVSSTVTASMTNDICSSGIGTVTANPTSGLAPYTFNWPALGSTNQTVNGVVAGNYTVNMTDAMGCTSSANVIVGDTPAAFSGYMSTIVSCPGGSDGAAFAEMIPVMGNLTYQWDDPMAQTTQTATGLTAGQYTCTITSDIGCFGIAVVDVTEIPGMVGNITNQTDVTCNSGSDGMIEVNVVQGTAPYSYSWDNSTSTANIATDLAVGPHTVTVTDSNGCVTTINGVLGEPQPLSISFLTPDTQICPEADITLSATGAGGSSPYTFTWFEAGVLIGTGDTMLVDPDVTNTQYCVEISEECGSPTSQECTLIYFPTPIVPSAVPDELSKCVPNTFELTNTSSNASEIATTMWEFGDHIDHYIVENGADSTSHYYDKVGGQTITMTVTSIYGCVYTATLTNLFEVLPSPIADFVFAPNYTSIFEPLIKIQDLSTNDVISWQYYSPNSIPTTSSSENPTFVFPEGVVGSYPVTLYVETAKGCVDSVTHYIDVVMPIIIYAPNAFTPNNDEHNQIWKPIIQGIDIYKFDLFIFNRWGEVIWENHNPDIGWDGTYNGKYVQAGTYVWRATVNDPYKDDKKEFNGTISILK